MIEWAMPVICTDDFGMHSCNNQSEEYHIPPTCEHEAGFSCGKCPKYPPTHLVC